MIMYTFMKNETKNIETLTLSQLRNRLLGDHSVVQVNIVIDTLDRLGRYNGKGHTIKRIIKR